MGGALANDKYQGTHRKMRQRKSVVVCRFCRGNKTNITYCEMGYYCQLLLPFLSSASDRMGKVMFSDVCVCCGVSLARIGVPPPPPRQEDECLVRGGRYASCNHAGGHSFFVIHFENIQYYDASNQDVLLNLIKSD